MPEGQENQLKSSLRKKTLHSSPAHKDGEKPPTQPYSIWTNILSPGFWKMVSMLDKSNFFFKVAVPVLCARTCRGSGEGSHNWGVLCYEFQLQAGTINDVSAKMF